MVRLIAIILVIVGMWFWWSEFPQAGFWHKESVWMPQSYEKAVRVILDDDGRVFEVMTKARTVGDFLQEQKIKVSEEDILFGSQEESMYDGKKLFIKRAKHIFITIDGSKRAIVTHQTNREKMFLENNIEIGKKDIITPKDAGAAVDGSSLAVMRVNIEEQSVDTPIVFTKTSEEDATLSFRKSIVTQKGENGIKRVTYKIVSHDGKEIDRTVVKQEIVKNPVAEKTVQGTRVEVGKAHTGLGSWYAYTGTMAAASPWLPMGSYVKVTNRDNGKTVIVKINDRGPFGKNRILDLDKVAFAKIASIGAGIISLKVEEITN